MKCYGSAPGNRGASLFPEGGALTHHQSQTGGGIPPVGRDRALSEGDAAPAGASGQCHASAELLSLSTQLVLCSSQRLPHFFMQQCVPTAIEKLPPEVFRCYGYRSGDTHFLFTKKKQKEDEGTVRANGDLSSGSKSCQPWHRAIRCCRRCIYELFSNSKRL